MHVDDILAALRRGYDGIEIVQTYGETTAFYNPGHRLPRGVYFATIKENDGPNDKASQLCREGVFRLSLGIGKDLFLERFGKPPARPPKGGVIAGDWPFTELDVLTPHPIYGWMSWVAINTPSPDRFEALAPLIDGAYTKARTAFDKRCASL